MVTFVFVKIFSEMKRQILGDGVMEARCDAPMLTPKRNNKIAQKMERKRARKVMEEVQLAWDYWDLSGETVCGLIPDFWFR